MLNAKEKLSARIIILKPLRFCPQEFTTETAARTRPKIEMSAKTSRLTGLIKSGSKTIIQAKTTNINCGYIDFKFITGKAKSILFLTYLIAEYF